jgi:hypothetical protein
MATKPGNNWKCPRCAKFVRDEMAKSCTACSKRPTVVPAPEPEPAPEGDPYAPTWTIVPEPESAAA